MSRRTRGEDLMKFQSVLVMSRNNKSEMRGTLAMKCVLR